MVRRPSDSEDATQEILIRVLTRLACWRGEASLLTWAYRLGINYLLNLRRGSNAEAQAAAAQLATLHDAAAVLRAHPDYAAPQSRVDAIVALLHSGRFPMLD